MKGGGDFSRRLFICLLFYAVQVNLTGNFIHW
jgi:hypothetical protein